jgi:hypothetical protein
MKTKQIKKENEGAGKTAFEGRERRKRRKKE